MKSFLGIGRKLNDQNQAKTEAERREKEAQEYDLVGTGGFLIVVKYVVFGILAALNFRLFYTVVHGAWGFSIAVTAVLFEAFAVYAWNNQKRSAGMHRQALIWIATIFTAVSFVHASASFYELIGAGPSLGAPLFVYSHYVAFPLLFTLMMVGVCSLYITHWSRRVAKAQAQTQTQTMIDRADLIRRTAELRNKSELERAELAHYTESLETDKQFVELLRQVVSVENEKASLLARISDPQTRRRMAELLGRDDNGDGVPDVLQKPELQREARSLLNGVDRSQRPN
jgi:hypothetical protein